MMVNVCQMSAVLAARSLPYVRQMSTTGSPNVHRISAECTPDVCQIVCLVSVDFPLDIRQMSSDVCQIARWIVCRIFGGFSARLSAGYPADVCPMSARLPAGWPPDFCQMFPGEQSGGHRLNIRRAFSRSKWKAGTLEWDGKGQGP